MKHPEIILLPVLMLADYYLTLYSDYLRLKKHSDYFDLESFELNLGMQKEIRNRRLFSPKHCIGVVFMTLALWCTSLAEEGVYEFILGFFLVTFGILLSRHIANIVMFDFVRRNAETIHGKISVSYEFSLCSSRSSISVSLIPLILVSVFRPSIFVFGGILANLNLIYVHFAWGRRHRKRRIRSRELQDEARS
ncbi:MAG TPA: hypothetical protein PKH07_08225 [bacterium]|nr:hypothetical protein [bacterium]